jgi:hypothetical protein
VRFYRVQPDPFPPAEDSGEVVPSTERQHRHRRPIVGLRFLEGTQDPRDRAVPTTHQDAIGHVLRGKCSDLVPRRLATGQPGLSAERPLRPLERCVWTSPVCGRFWVVVSCGMRECGLFRGGVFHGDLV